MERKAREVRRAERYVVQPWTELFLNIFGRVFYSVRRFGNTFGALVIVLGTFLELWGSFWDHFLST